MPSLVLMPLAGGAIQTVELNRAATSIGNAPGCHVRLTGEATGIHAHAEKAGDAVTLVATARKPPYTVNGKKEASAALATGDVIRFPAHVLVYFATQAPLAAGAPMPQEAMKNYRHLYEFALELARQEDSLKLLGRMMDGIVELTRADRGILMLADAAGALTVRVSRNFQGESLFDAMGGVSDSIVARVVSEQKPLIVADALSDTEFGRAESVMNLKLASVMCVPLLHHGRLMGVIYVGNDRVKDLFGPQDLELLAVFAGQASLLLASALEREQLARDNLALRDALQNRRYGEILGASEPMQQVFKTIERVAQADVPVLIEGETGTGKELVAREIHRRSRRGGGPFVPVNCAAIPENLIESEFFGHRKGSFTGATADRPGRFESADGGTLFLDEIGDMPLHVQVKVLRALQEKTITPVGDTRERKVDVRIVAATNRDLEKMMAAGQFREDLYYRLNVIRIALPPLRQRGADLATLARYFLHRYGQEIRGEDMAFSDTALRALSLYAWPGNIRELENRIKKAVVMADGNTIHESGLSLPAPEGRARILPLNEAREDFVRRYIHEVLEQNGGNRTQTARDLGVDPRTIFRYLERGRDSEPEL